MSPKKTLSKKVLVQKSLLRKTERGYPVRGSDLDLVRRFCAQVRGAFMGAGPTPSFKVKQDSDGVYRVKGISKIKFDIVPRVSFPEADCQSLSDLKFQTKVNGALRSKPVVLTGKDDVIAPDGGKAEDVSWRVEIDGLSDIRMDCAGAIGVFGYKIGKVSIKQEEKDK